jgi:hypothetical protein
MPTVIAALVFGVIGTMLSAIWLRVVGAHLDTPEARRFLALMFFGTATLSFVWILVWECVR